MIKKVLLPLLVCLLAGTPSLVWSMTDKATGIRFAPKKGELELFGVGVRKKGPISVYSVGMYCTAALKEKLATISKSAQKGKQRALAALCDGAKEGPEAAFLLQMSFKVGAEKISAAIADSVSSRFSGGAGEVDSLKTLIFDGVAAKGGTATKGTTFLFDCSPQGIEVAVDGSVQGRVDSAGLSKAFCDVYLDDKCVSPKLRESCLENCCAP